MKVAILGFGNVASACVENFLKNRETIDAKTRDSIEITKVATRTPSRAAGRVSEDCEVTDDCWEAVNDPNVDVVLELIGDVKVARQLVLRAIENKKHIVTANKAMLALHGEELMAKAHEHNCIILFEGAVAVSIPIVKILREASAANKISSIVGILNGTSNYVLSQMEEHNLSIDEAISAAQEMGYAEADPALDVNGGDAAHKLTLLASLGFGIPIDFHKIDCNGIGNIKLLDVKLALQMGFRIKLIASATQTSNEVKLSVQPMLVPAESYLGLVASAMNGVAIQGDLMKSAFFYGSGAGGVQTSSAILSDLMDLANGRHLNPESGSYNMGFSDVLNRTSCHTIEDDPYGFYYLRISSSTDYNSKSSLREILENEEIKITKINQNKGHLPTNSDFSFVTDCVSSKKLRNVASKLIAANVGIVDVVVYPIYQG
jgi:homoserine dehydrogenase